MRRRVLAAAAATVIAASTLAACAPGDTTAGDDDAPYRIGLIASQSGAGSTIGKQQFESTAWAVERINDAGGIGGRRLEIVYRDDRSDPERGPEVIRELIEDEQVVAIIGPTLSIVAREAHPVANALRTPVLAISNTVDGIVGACPYACEWIWRESLSERIAVQANVAAYVHDAQPRTAVTVRTQDDVLGMAGITYAQQTFQEHGVPVVGSLEVGMEETMTGELEQLLAEQPDVLFLGSTFTEWVVGVMREARALGYEGQFLAGNILNSETARELAGEAGLGTRSGAAWVATNRFPANEQFIDDYQRALGRMPDQFDAQGYVAIQIIADALGRADPA
ncbi:MAG TPA: ABC transporter substrate-binding protein, partial [Microbacteriaceae bacterium]|nr:ABC transporter substrate-binding protein [Microbacteriaceae bacterium]HWL01313.1 ABC transporter substrate-binding protein [Microbacteriaceae bacterium]